MKETLHINVNNVLKIFFLLLIVLSSFLNIYLCYVVVSLSFIFTILSLNSKSEVSFIKVFKINFIDIAFVLVVLSEFINYKFSSYPLNSVLFLSKFLIAYFIYWFYRINFYNNEVNKNKVIIFISVIGVVLAILTIYRYILINNLITGVGFKDFTDFRNLFVIFDSPSNEWITIFLAILPFAIFLFYSNYKHLTLQYLYLGFVIIILHALQLSFSRGIFIAILIFFVISMTCIYFTKVFDLKTLLKLNGIIIILATFSLAPYTNAAKSTIIFNKTVSQQRSINGRINTWDNSYNLFKHRNNYLFGIGSNTFALNYNKFRHKSNDSSFGGRISNTFLQILVEKGIIGCIIYCFLFLCISFFLLMLLLKAREVDKLFLCLILASFIAIAIRELSFSSFFSNILLMLIFSIMCAYLSNEICIKTPIFKNWNITKIRLYIILATLFLPLLWGSVHLYKNFRSNKLNNEYIDSFQNNDLRLSLKCINKAIEYSSDNALLYAHKALIEYKELDENKIINLNNIKLEKKDIDDVKLSAVINLYLKALSLNYNDDCFHHNLGWLYLLKGENRKAFQEISESIAIDSNIAIYHISKGLFFEINNQLDSALYEYKIAIKLSPDILDSYFYSGLKSRYYFKADSIVKVAKKELNDDFTLTKSPILCARLAKIYFTTQDTVEAKRLYEITVEVLPNLNRPWYYLAIIDGKYAKHKKTTETYLKRATLLDNSDYLPTLALADFYEQTALSYNTVIEYYKSSIKNWIHLSSEHSLRVKIIYNQNTLKNDLIPIGLLNHCKPKFDIEKACEKVASIYNKEGVKNMADYYLTLAHNSENIVLQNIK